MRLSAQSRVTVVVASTALLIAGAPAGARPLASTLSPPAIHERFTALPCDGAPTHRTTLQQEACAEHQIVRGDKQIDALNETISSRLTAHAARRRFVRGHTVWLAYRRAYCLSRSDTARGGTEADVVDATCAIRLNSQHIEILRDFLAALDPS